MKIIEKLFPEVDIVEQLEFKYTDYIYKKQVIIVVFNTLRYYFIIIFKCM